MRILIQNGQVVDPVAGTMRTADVVLDRGRIAWIGERARTDPQAAEADRRIDARGLVVGPGFIDVHSHVHSVQGHRVQAHDGVTSALDLEAGLSPVSTAYAEAAADGRPLNYGFSASWAAARGEVLMGRPASPRIADTLALVSDPAWQRASSPDELDRWLAYLESELSNGAVGIGVLQGYAPMTPPDEYRLVARLAADHQVPVFTHARELSDVDARTPIDGPTEIVRAAVETGASMHFCHVNSTSRRHLDRVLQMLTDAVAAGASVSVEAYPYGFGTTAVGAAFLSPEGLASWGITPRSLVMLGTGERIRDAARLNHLREIDPAAPCVVEFLDERVPEDADLISKALGHLDTIVASDAAPLVSPGTDLDAHEWPPRGGTMTHPRTAGTFARALRTKVREEAEWSWPEAFRRCSLLAAQLLEGVVPSMVRKGRMEVGADADLVIIDPAAVTDRATMRDPVRTSVGVRHLLVAGELVIEDGVLNTEALPGRPLRGTAS